MCSKNSLAALNVLYIMVAFILISVAAYAQAVTVFTDIKIMGGIIACGVFLLLIAILGLIGAVKHHQVLLFFYMIILFLLFLVQFAVACACLAISNNQQEIIAQSGWKMAKPNIKQFVQERKMCCGFQEKDQDIVWKDSQNVSPVADSTQTEELLMGHPACNLAKLDCCRNSSAVCCTGVHDVNVTATKCPCRTCWTVTSADMGKAIKIAGGIGLFFSFTEIIGVWLTVRYRNQKDPRANPSAFL